LLNGKRRAYYVLRSHWGREWHEPFQDFCYRSVQMMDRALAGLADGRLKGPYTTDGQAKSWKTTWKSGPSAATALFFLRRDQVFPGTHTFLSAPT
jgi:hypothetical protein